MKMKKLTLINYFFALLTLLIVWFPATRLFMIGFKAGDVIVIGISLMLFLSSCFTYKRSLKKVDLIPLFISFSPLVFFLFTLGLVYFRLIPPAP